MDAATPGGGGPSNVGAATTDASAPSATDASTQAPAPGHETGAASNDAGTPTAGDASLDAGRAASALPPVADTDGPGPFETTQDLNAGPSGKSGVFRPTELGRGGLRHPLFVWGCGGGSTPMSYAELMDQIASHGFVVIAETSTIDDRGAPLSAAIDWLIAEDQRADSMFYEKLDTTKIALGGHSIGSVNAFFVATDPRLNTTIHVAGGSLDMSGNISAPTTGSGGKRLIHPVAFICSEMDTFGNVQKTELDYENATVPAWMTVMSGVDHVAATREGLPAIIAWLRWQLAGESGRKGAFLDPTGAFNSGKYVSKHKNW